MSIQQLRDVAARRNLLDHSFYRRWVEGTLSIGELRDYSAQYMKVVQAIPKWLGAAAAAEPALAAHAAEEESHVDMWARFAAALGVEPAGLAATAPNAATTALLAAGDRHSEAGFGVPVVWALEAQTPAVSAAKLDGLREHYGIEAGEGGRYFDVHQVMDVDHARQLEAVIEGRPGLAEVAPAVAREMTELLWDLLTSVEAPVPA